MNKKTIVAIIGIGAIVALCCFYFMSHTANAQEGIETKSNSEWITSYPKVLDTGMHPCQQVGIDTVQLSQENADMIRNGATDEEADKWKIEFMNREEASKQTLIEHDCIDLNTMQPKGDWFTAEYQRTLQKLIDEFD